MNAKFVYPMTLAALLAFGSATLAPVYAQDSEQQPQQEQTQPQGEGGSSGSSD